MSARDAPPLRTYSHLAAQRRIPSEYEIASTNLLYHPQRGFETEVPLRAWYERYQRDGRLVCGDWEKFADPRATTYPAYTALQAEQEGQLDGVMRSWETAEHEPALLREWGASFVRTVAPLRFALHGFQMIAAYVGQMAPSGRITIAALFQCADELRRVHRLAYHLGWLRRALAPLADDSRAAWQEAPAWQPLRRAVELALVTYDWGEALVALDLCLKPMLEGLFLAEGARRARAQGDFLVGETLASFDRDGRWHQAWSAALLRLALTDRPQNVPVVEGWVARWDALAREATGAAASLFGDHGSVALARAERSSRDGRAALGLGAR